MSGQPAPVQVPPAPQAKILEAAPLHTPNFNWGNIATEEQPQVVSNNIITYTDTDLTKYVVIPSFPNISAKAHSKSLPATSPIADDGDNTKGKKSACRDPLHISAWSNNQRETKGSRQPKGNIDICLSEGNIVVTPKGKRKRINTDAQIVSLDTGNMSTIPGVGEQIYPSSKKRRIQKPTHIYGAEAEPMSGDNNRDQLLNTSPDISNVANLIALDTETEEPLTGTQEFDSPRDNKSQTVTINPKNTKSLKNQRQCTLDGNLERINKPQVSHDDTSNTNEPILSRILAHRTCRHRCSSDVGKPQKPGTYTSQWPNQMKIAWVIGSDKRPNHLKVENLISEIREHDQKVLESSIIRVKSQMNDINFVKPSSIRSRNKYQSGYQY